MKFKKYTIKEGKQLVITYVFTIWLWQIKIRRVKIVRDTL